MGAETTEVGAKRLKGRGDDGSKDQEPAGAAGGSPQGRGRFFGERRPGVGGAEAVSKRETDQRVCRRGAGALLVRRWRLRARRGPRRRSRAAGAGRWCGAAESRVARTEAAGGSEERATCCCAAGTTSAAWAGLGLGLRSTAAGALTESQGLEPRLTWMPD